MLTSSRFILFLVLSLGLVLRLWGIGFGLPFRYHPDESQHVVEAATMLKEHRLEPAVFNNPPLYKYLLMVADAGIIAGGLLSGVFESIQDFSSRMALDPSLLYLTGRILSALAGSLTVWLVYLIGREAFDRQIGLLSAVFMAVAFLPVRDSHYAVNDSLLVLLTTSSLLGSTRILTRSLGRDYILAACAAGLAFATKYTAAFVVLPLIWAHLGTIDTWKRLKDLKLKWLAGAGLLVCVSAVLGSPYFVLKPGKVYQDIHRSVYSYGQYGFEGWKLDDAGGFLFYLKAMIWGLGWPLFLLCLFGIVLAMVRRRKVEILLLLFPVTLYLFMGRQEMYFSRFILPAIPPLVVLAAAAGWTAANRLMSKVFQTGSVRRMRPITGFLMVLLVVFPSLRASARHDFLMTQKDTRTLAKEWIELNVAAGSRIAVDWPYHAPPLSNPRKPAPDSTREYDVEIVGGIGLAAHPIEYYLKEGFHILVSSSNISNLTLSDDAKKEERKAFYQSLDTTLNKLIEIRPGRQDPSFIFDEVYGPAVSLWERERPGPVVSVYSIH